jgi:hypothetical protein
MSDLPIGLNNTLISLLQSLGLFVLTFQIDDFAA